MTSLYNIGNELESIVSDVTTLLENGADPSSAEVQELLQKMVAQESDWDKKAVNVAKYLQYVKQQQEVIKAEIDRLDKKSKQMQSQYNNLHDLLLFQMQSFGKTEIKDPILSIKVRDNPFSLFIQDESVIPEQYKKEKVTVTVDKTAIRNAIKNGEHIDGADLISSQRLEFK